MILQMAIMLKVLAKKIVATTMQVLTVQEIAARNRVTAPFLHFGCTILKILKRPFFLRAKDHSHYTINPIILQGFIPSGNRLK
ncbi:MULTISPECIES: hypothetical protein [Albibacterium]|uniref:Uncharacterized protein n=1 Tax=Albibacterium profundi TaxID=3134906 RepID=A0ABV5CFT4_9SPHI|nr:hypothetical protein [Pedobacter indicus]